MFPYKSLAGSYIQIRQFQKCFEDMMWLSFISIKNTIVLILVMKSEEYICIYK